MADLSINPINTAQAPMVTASSAPSRAAQAASAGAAGGADKGQEAAKKAAESTQKAIESAKKDSERRAELRAREETATKEFGPVVSKSGDGDTLRVKSDTEAAASSDESKIYDSGAATTVEAPKPEVQNFEIPKPETPEVETPKQEYVPFEFPDEIKNQSAASTTAEQGSVTATNEKAAQSASIKNASESELKRMYLQGDISSVQYNNEVEERQEKTEAMKAENNQFTAEMTKDAAAETANERQAGAIEELGSEDASQSIPVEVREQFVQNMDFS